MSDVLICTVAALVLAGVLHAAPEAVNLRAVRVDTLERVYPDRWPEGSGDEPLAIPRGATAAVQIAVTSDTPVRAMIGVSPLVSAGNRTLEASVRTFEVLPVPVEANTNGGSKTAVGVRPPDEWMEAFVREAPFEVCEVLAPAATLALMPRRTSAALVEVTAPRSCRAGRYTGEITLEAAGETVALPIELRVHPTVLEEQHAIHVHNWMFPQPENLTQGDPPAWWSDEHWALLEASGRVMRRYGQDTILTPLIDYEHPLIEVIREPDGRLSFEYTRFDRWVHLFDRLGYRLFAGHHISMLPEAWVYGNVWVTDRETGERSVLFERGGGNPEWLEFLPMFYDSLYAHLGELGVRDRYIQHQLDEPKDTELYAALAELARKHMPGVRTIDAINSDPEGYSPLVDIAVFALIIIGRQHDLAAQRAIAGQANWLYHCCSPPPPYPNRHLDERLANSRVYPWMAHLLGADGYLYWGANVYRGADPYATSIGPLPNGSQDPGHPPGDNWLFYPGPDGLRASMRMVAFRDGLMDQTLLAMLTKRNPEAARRILPLVTRSIDDYARTPTPYHRAQRRLLVALDVQPDRVNSTD